MSQAIYDNFIKDDRWRYITDGLQVTLEVTFFFCTHWNCHRFFGSGGPLHL